MSEVAKRCSLGTLVCAVLTSCSPDVNADRQSRTDQVHQVVTGIIAADNARDIDQVMTYYARDAVLFPPSESTVSGVEAIRPRYETLFEQYIPEIEGEVSETIVHEGFAYVWGRNRGWLRGRGNLEDRSLNDVYLMILRRADAGQWKINALMWQAGPVNQP